MVAQERRWGGEQRSVNLFRSRSLRGSNGGGPAKCKEKAEKAVNSCHDQEKCFSPGPGDLSVAQHKESCLCKKPRPQPGPGKQNAVPSCPNLCDAHRTALVASPRSSTGDSRVTVRKYLRRLTPMLVLSWFWLASLRYSLKAHEKSLRGGHPISPCPLREGREGAVVGFLCNFRGFTPIYQLGENK